MGVLNVLFHTRQLLYGFTKTNEKFLPAKIKREIINNIFGVVNRELWILPVCVSGWL